MNSFSEIEDVWSERLENLRNVVRQQVIRHQLASLPDTIATALDVGCGQGTQAIELAARDIDVTGVDPSADLLDRLTTTASDRGVSVRTVHGTLDDLDEIFTAKTYDLVMAHGVLMYVEDAAAAVSSLARRVARGGTLSITFRNQEALAYRPGLRGQWQRTLAAFDATTYVNELGATARAHTLAEVTRWCEDAGLRVERWYGVRVLTDGAPADEMPDQETIVDCIAAEIEAGSRDPYRGLASQLHVIARR